MDVSPEIPETQPNTLHIDFSWRKFKTLITENENPLYTVRYKFNTKEIRITVKSAAENVKEARTVGDSVISSTDINANYELHGRSGMLKSLKRFENDYTHLSHTFSNITEDGAELGTMTWSADRTLKRWTFVCSDENDTPVAKVTANIFAMKKVGTIEVFSPHAPLSVAQRDEIVLTGLTLMYLVAARSSSITMFFNSLFADTGPIEKDKAETTQKATGDGKFPDGGAASGKVDCP
jgi:hypothetical protein